MGLLASSVSVKYWYASNSKPFHDPLRYHRLLIPQATSCIPQNYPLRSLVQYALSVFVKYMKSHLCWSNSSNIAHPYSPLDRPIARLQPWELCDLHCIPLNQIPTDLYLILPYGQMKWSSSVVCFCINIQWCYDGIQQIFYNT